MIEDYRSVVNRILKERIKSSRDQILMVDMFCTAMMDVPKELNVPCYVFITSNAAFLDLTFHFQSLRDDHGVDVTEFTDPKTELDVPGFKNQVPCSVLLMVFLDKDRGCDDMLNNTKKYREAKGILINTFMELESHAIQSLSNDPKIPTFCPIGPIIDLNAHNQGGAGGPHGDAESIMRWLDDQPTTSVVFLCFGSLGSFPEDQVREMAKGLERSGHRFFWSLRRPPTADDRFNHPTDFENLEQVLPERFLDRTAKVGKIIGWAPQVAILSHPAVGGFASHCGWNSILESLWMGVPIAAWPMYAEQQLNAFAMVKELGLAVEIWKGYKWNHRKRVSNGIVEADAIERGIKMLMDNGNDNAVRAKVQEMSEVCRRAAMEGG